MSKKIAIVGCGAFGAMIAVKLSENDFDVTIFEKEKECLGGASLNNQNRLHLGFHYPRDTLTAKQCIKGFKRFCEEFPECIVDGFPNLYFIAENDSFTSSNSYEDFCRELNLENEVIASNDLPIAISNVSKAIKCGEVVYDCNILRSLILERLDSSGTQVNNEILIDDIKKTDLGHKIYSGSKELGSFDHVINCTYANINHLTEKLGYSIDEAQFEYTFIPIIKTDIEKIGITVMDGPFMTLLPFGNTEYSLMYHVDHSVIERDKASKINNNWLSKETSPAKYIDLNKRFKEMRDACSYFVPALIESQMIDFLQGPRMVIANSDSTDARPSILKTFEKNYHTVFSGKIDHCIWIADDILEQVSS